MAQHTQTLDSGMWTKLNYLNNVEARTSCLSAPGIHHSVQSNPATPVETAPRSEGLMSFKSNVSDSGSHTYSCLLPGKIFRFSFIILPSGVFFPSLKELYAFHLRITF